MNFRICSVLISLCVHFFFHWSGAIREERFSISEGFLPYKTVTSIREYCTCSTPYRCSCCQVVTLFHSKSQKNLCINFVFQGNGIQIDATLNLSNIKSRRVTDYRPLKFCINVPGCIFSSTCINVVELNQFSRSITACLRLDIYTKKRIWQINYDCVSISMVPSTMITSATTKMMNATTSGSSGTVTMTTRMTTSSGQTTKSSGQTTLSSRQTTMATTSMTTTTMKTTTTSTMTPPKVETEETTSDVEIITFPGTGSTTVIDID